MTTAMPQERYGEVLFADDHGTEDERLTSLASAFDPASRATLSAMGISPQATCLDVGAGAGTLSRWLAETVQSPEQVTALDRDPRFLRQSAPPGLRIVQGDITDPNLHPGQFDLVHTRFTLMHLRERATVLPRLASWVKPGGLLVVSDAEAIGGEHVPHDAYRTTIQALWRMLTDTIGTDPHCASQWPGVFADLGLQDIGCDAHFPTTGADRGYTRFLELTLHEGHANLLARGLEAKTFQNAIRHLAQPRTREPFIAMITTYGRKPSQALAG